MPHPHHDAGRAGDVPSGDAAAVRHRSHPALRHRVLAVVALVVTAAGCRESPTSPYRPVTSAAPVGLAASLTSARGAASSERPSLAAQHDSVVAAVTLSASGCMDYAAQAGLDRGTLVVTIVSSFPAVARACTADLSYARFRAVVRGVPAGRYTAVLRSRVEGRVDGAQEREVARAALVVR